MESNPVVANLLECIRKVDVEDVLNLYIYTEALVAVISSTNKKDPRLPNLKEKSINYKKQVQENYTIKSSSIDRCPVEELSFASGTENACLTFSSVQGNEAVKRDLINGFVNPLLYPGLFGKTTKGILLYGPPGTAKTVLAKASVNELSSRGKGNIRIHVFAPTASELKGKYFGEAEKNIKGMFSCASARACQSTKEGVRSISVIFLDEVESLAGDRRNDSTGFMTTTVNALLQAIEGVDSAPNVSVIAATNFPWTLDGAFLRRLPVQSFVDMPTADDIYGLIYSGVKNHILKVLKTRDPIESYCKKERTLNLGCDERLDERELEYLDNYFFSDEVRKVSLDLAARNFSGSDVVAILSKLIKTMGEEATRAGTFLLKEVTSNTPITYYISTIGCKENLLLTDTDKLVPIYVISKPDTVSVTINGVDYVNSKVFPLFQIADPRVKNVFIKEGTMFSSPTKEIVLEFVNIYEGKQVREESVYVRAVVSSAKGFIARQWARLRGIEDVKQVYSLDSILSGEVEVIDKKGNIYTNMKVVPTEHLVFKVPEDEMDTLDYLIRNDMMYSFLEKQPGDVITSVPGNIEFNKPDGEDFNVIPMTENNRLFHLHFSSARLMEIVAESQPTNREEDVKELRKYSANPSKYKKS